MEVEEGEAVVSPQRRRSHDNDKKSPYDALQESRVAMEEIAAKMLFIKKEARPKSDLRELLLQMALLFVNFRQVNRAILIEEDRVKAETEAAKAPVDFTTLQLHNLMYEKNHYLKAIKTCKDFRSKYPDIELVPEDEFFSSAPDDIRGDLVSKDNPHDLMLKRLNFELYQRKELCKLHEELEQRKKGLQETIANRKKFLSSLPSHLKSLKKASMPVQQQLGINHTKKLKQHHCAELLPPPLYIIYSQFLAQKEAFGVKIDLEIVGNVKDAQTFAYQLANKDTGLSANTENGKLDEDPLDDEEEGQRRRKRPKKTASKEAISESGMYQSHPLNIILHVYDDEDDNGNDDIKTNIVGKLGKLVTLRFEYLLKLNVVCAGIEGSEDGPQANILCNLFPDDTGLDLPHQTAKIFVGDAVSFDEKRLLRPYKWAQHLAGIDFLPEASPFLVSGIQSSVAQCGASVLSGLSLYRQQNRINTVMQRIRSRKKAQMALTEQIDSLTKLKWPSLIYERIPWASHVALCSLQSCTQGVPLFNHSPSASVVAMERVPDSLDVDVDGRCESAREDGELPSVVQAPALITDAKPSPSAKGPHLELSRQLALMSKSMNVSKTVKSKVEDYSDMLLEEDSDLDEVVDVDQIAEQEIDRNSYEMDKSWEDFAAKELCLVLSRTVNEKRVNLEAKIKISMEYPLRPPLFSLNLLTSLAEDDFSGDGTSYAKVGHKWFNELRAMEAEVNLHILKMLPLDYENQTLAHQVSCLAMMFDFQMDGLTSFSTLTKSSSLIDVGLCKPVSGKFLARSFRGRDRRKMISWKDMECTSGFPY